MADQITTGKRDSEGNLIPPSTSIPDVPILPSIVPATAANIIAPAV